MRYYIFSSSPEASHLQLGNLAGVFERSRELICTFPLGKEVETGGQKLRFGFICNQCGISGSPCTCLYLVLTFTDTLHMPVSSVGSQGHLAYAYVLKAPFPWRHSTMETVIVCTVFGNLQKQTAITVK